MINLVHHGTIFIKIEKEITLHEYSSLTVVCWLAMCLERILFLAAE